MTPRTMLVIGLCTVLVLAGGAALWMVPVLLMGFAGSQPDNRGGSGPAQCVNSSGWVGDVPDTARSLTDPQLGMAKAIYDTTRQAGFGDDTHQAAVIAIMTAMQESTLGADPATHVPNNDDDAGPFQIRVRMSWHAETLTQALDITYATNVFLNGHTVTPDQAARAQTARVKEPNPAGYTIPGLKQVTGWQQLSPNYAAQAVQRSAYPLAYAKHEPMARALVAAMTGSRGPLLCGNTADAATNCPATNNPAETGLTPDALRTFRCTLQRWPQLKNFSTLRDDALPYHPSGRAIDFMIPNWQTPAGNTLGWQIAQHLQTNAQPYGVDHIIFDRKIWSSRRAGEGWRSCSAGSCYTGPDPTAAHQDHVHVTVTGNTGTGGGNSGAESTVLPVARYTLTARFGQCGAAWASCHTGLDFAAPTGTSAVSVQPGSVISAGWAGAYGNLVKVDHGQGVVSYYAHLSAITTTVGQKLNAGQQVGHVGETGNAFGAHLHLEIRIAGSSTDPARWLTAKGATP